MSVIMSCEPDVEQYFETARELALDAGQLFKRGFEGEKVVDFKGHRWDVVTDYDKKIEKLLFDGLKSRFPDHQFIGEETTADEKRTPELTDKPTWIIDPIDGTINYVNQVPFTCISIALTIRKELAIGIIYNPVTSELYSAIKGRGAFLNGKPIRTSSVTELKSALMEFELFSLRSFIKDRDIRSGRLEAFVNATKAIRFMGSATLSLAYVAKGALDCLQMDKLQPWDVAAGVLIVREAGGAVMDTKEDNYDIMRPNTIAAANETLAKEMRRLIVDTDLKTLRRRLTKT